jgi:hypothetical protein
MAGRRRKRGRRGLFNKRRSPDDQVAQREAAFAAIRLLYSEALPLWRSCPRGTCRRHKSCAGDGASCLKRGWPLMPPELQQLAYAQAVRGGPHRRPPATHVSGSCAAFRRRTSCCEGCPQDAQARRESELNFRLAREDAQHGKSIAAAAKAQSVANLSVFRASSSHPSASRPKRERRCRK